MPTKAFIISKEKRNDTIITLVKYDYTGSFVGTATVEVYHYRPQSVEEINTNITNRGISEKQRLQSLDLIDEIFPNIPTEIENS